MAVEVLRCRICGSEYPAVANGVCSQCFGPLEPVYDWDAASPSSPRASGSRPARARSGATAICCRPTPPEDGASGPGWTPLVPAPRLASALGIGEVFLKLDLANPTHSFKDRVVAVAAAKAKEFGLETLSATSTGNLANAVAARAAAIGMRAVIFCPAELEPEKFAGDDGLRRPDLRRARQLRRLLAARQRARRRGRVGDRQRQPPLVLRGGLEDARVRDLRAARLGDARRGRDADRLGRDVHEGLEGLRAVPPARAGRRRRCRSCSAARPRAARRSRPRSPSERARHAGAPALDRLVDRDRQPGRRRSRESRSPATPAAAIYAVPEDEVGANISLLAETAGDLRRRRDRRRGRRPARGGARGELGEQRSRRRCSSPAPA